MDACKLWYAYIVQSYSYHHGNVEEVISQFAEGYI